MRRPAAHLRLVDEAAEAALREEAKTFLQHSIGDYLPPRELIAFETAFNSSSWSKVVTSTAAQRLRDTKNGREYHDAFVEQMALCYAIVG